MYVVSRMWRLFATSDCKCLSIIWWGFTAIGLKFVHILAEFVKLFWFLLMLIVVAAAIPSLIFTTIFRLALASIMIWFATLCTVSAMSFTLVLLCLTKYIKFHIPYFTSGCSTYPSLPWLPSIHQVVMLAWTFHFCFRQAEFLRSLSIAYWRFRGYFDQHNAEESLRSLGVGDIDGV